MSAGDYVRNTWQNGAGVGHPPINATNLNNIESKLLELDTLMANDFENYRFEKIKQYFWQRNCKEIHMFDDSSLWGTSGCTASESSTPITGLQDLAINDSDNLAGTIYVDDTISVLDLEKFNDGEASGTDDIIAFSVYLFTHPFFTSITLWLGADSGNYWTYTWNPTESYQVTFQAKKSAFGVGAGAPDWGNIAYVRLTIVTTAGAQFRYVIPLALMMYRNDPVSDGVANPFQLYDGATWTNFFEQNTPLWNLYFDYAVNEVGIICLNDYNLSAQWDGLKVKSSIINFVWKTVFHTYTDYTNVMVWYYDSNNMIKCWIDNDDFTLDVVEAGVSSPYTFTLSTSLEKELLTIKLEKNETKIIATLVKGNEPVSILEHTTTISVSLAGDLYFGYDTRGLSFITDFEISYRNNISLDVWDKPKLIIKKNGQQKINDAVAALDPELYCYLPPNMMFTFDVTLKFKTNANATPDIRISWTSSGLSYVSRRTCLSIPSNTTNPYDTNVYFIETSLSTTVAYGCDASSNPSVAYEKFILKTGSSGGYLALLWAQNVSNAAYTELMEYSNIVITPLQLLQNK